MPSAPVYRRHGRPRDDWKLERKEPGIKERVFVVPAATKDVILTTAFIDVSVDVVDFNYIGA